MKKILVLGGAGYLGSVLVPILLERNYNVIVFDKGYYGFDGLADLHHEIEIIQGDIRHIDINIFKDIDTVINIAGLSNDPTAEYRPEANYEMNYKAAISCGSKAKLAGVSRYIYASTCSVYYSDHESDNDHLRLETDPIDPQAPYSRSKFLAERDLLEMNDDKLSVVILRKGTLFGYSPRMRYDLVVNTFVKDGLARRIIKLHWGGRVWRPLLGIKDAAQVYVDCVEAPDDKVSGQIFNVASINVRISELAIEVGGILWDMGIHCRIVCDNSYTGMLRDYRVSTRKIEETLSFAPNQKLRESIQEMLEHIKKEGLDMLSDPVYSNIRWMKTLDHARTVIETSGSLF